MTRRVLARLLAVFALCAALGMGSVRVAHGQPFVPIFVTRIIFGSTAGVVIRSGSGTPEASITAPPGSLYLRDNGAAGTSFYVKESGTGNTGWGAYAASSVTSASSNTFTNKTYDVEGTGNVLTIPFTIFWEAAQGYSNGIYPATFNMAGTIPPSPTASAQTDSNYIFGTLDFDDSNTEVIYRDFLLPTDWSGNIDLKFIWYTTVTTGNVVWQVRTSCTADNESVDPSGFSFNAANTVTDAAKGTSSLMNVATLSAITTTGCSAGELLHLKIFRDPTNGSDTIGATAALIGIEFTYRRSL